MTVNQLREMLRKSGLTVSGKKADLIKRLQYSARAKKALISPSCGEETKKPKSVIKGPKSDAFPEGTTNSKSPSDHKDSNDLKVESSVKKSVRKRLISRSGSSDNATSKRLKICQETISSSLRKRSPVASSTSKAVSSRSRISPTTPSALKSKRTPPSQIQTRSSRRISPSSANSTSSNRLTRSANNKTSVRKADKGNKENKPSIYTNKTTTTQKSDMVSKPQRLTSRKRSDPLSTITNSAKKRKSDRRASMKKSVNQALLQLEQQMEVL